MEACSYSSKFIIQNSEISSSSKNINSMVHISRLSFCLLWLFENIFIYSVAMELQNEKYAKYDNFSFFIIWKLWNVHAVEISKNKIWYIKKYKKYDFK